ncbi:MAG: phosphatidylglycerophosphatase A [Xanthomonadaceae bacterium]|nr:phosphatidylglycerophosphatase A [Xanthomonadaceae bacterium]MDE1886399.1 phosphatidylglycerophosphatase A [Xanthomonadaceae bacterium]MDE1961194.1 phosphatidylglycerophosphatase A [Xanthomonadaceae bacterium]MDE2084321.1 phosphatidylglycerophosphatase A [Xanthomonadaceae bacterium]MDE2257846.1 phosphatidylglycerophosphatase A [Xanthomonadaceae bacterium]
MSHDASSRRALLGHPLGWIASGFGSGLSPVAPGTAGSLAALLPWLVLRALPWPWFAVALVLAFALGVGVCAWAVRRLRSADPSAVVWDEFVGQWIALTPLLIRPHDYLWIFAGFILFRLFDIVKPWPVSWADRRIGGGLGVMLDDAIAGIYAAAALALALRFI